MKKMLKNQIGTLIDTTLTGVSMQQAGNNFTGSTKGIGNATQVVLGAGLLTRTAKKNGGFLK